MGMATNGEKLDNIYFMLGEVRSDTKSVKEDIEGIRDLQEKHGKYMRETRNSLNGHLNYHENKKEFKEKTDKKKAGIMVIAVGAIAIIVNLAIEGFKVAGSIFLK